MYIRYRCPGCLNIHSINELTTNELKKLIVLLYAAGPDGPQMNKHFTPSEWLLIILAEYARRTRN